MKAPTQMWLVLVIGLAFGYWGGIATMMQIRGHAGGKQTAESSQLIAAKERLAVLKQIFTDQSVLVQAQVQKVRQLEVQRGKL